MRRIALGGSLAWRGFQLDGLALSFCFYVWTSRSRGSFSQRLLFHLVSGFLRCFFVRKDGSPCGEIDFGAAVGGNGYDGACGCACSVLQVE
jgi:hypothetical protein